MTLNKVALGLAAGILTGGCILLATIWTMVAGGGEHLELLARFYPGYGVHPLGALLGLIYGFIDGFICGWLLAWLYNRFA